MCLLKSIIRLFWGIPYPFITVYGRLYTVWFTVESLSIDDLIGSADVQPRGAIKRESGGRRCAAAKRWIYTRDRERARVVSCQGISLDEMAIGTSPEIEGKIMNKCETDLHFSILREINEGMMQTFDSAAARRTWLSRRKPEEAAAKHFVYSMLSLLIISSHDF